MAGFQQYDQNNLERDLMPPDSSGVYQRQNVPKVFENKVRQAAQYGVAPLTYVLNISQTRQLKIPHKLGTAPICEVWMRDGTAALQVGDPTETPIYQLPFTVPVSGSYYYWYADEEFLYIRRIQGTTGGAGSFTMLFDYFIYGDKFGMKTVGIQGTQSTV